MSQQFSVPANYPAVGSPELDIPSSMLPADLKQLKGVSTSQRSVFTSSGTAGASSTILFNIPTGMSQGYLKSGTLYLRCKIVVTQANGAGVTWNFAGGNTAQSPFGGASSIIDRLVVSCGGVQVSVINNYNHWRNMMMAHGATVDYAITDSRELEYTGVTKVNTLANVDNRTVYVSIPILAPVFNASNHIPAFLLNSPISIELTTAPVASAFQTATNAITAYDVSEASLVYDMINVSEEYKQAMMMRLAQSGGAYSMELNDVYNIAVAHQNPLDFNVGLSLSSLKAVCGTYLSNASLGANLAQQKLYNCNGLSDFKLYADNRLINSVIIDNDSVTFAELNKALGRLGDYNISSILQGLNPADGTSVRNNYTTDAFMMGVSCQTISDFNFSVTGIPCQQLTVHTENNNTDAVNKWQSAGVAVASTLFLFIFYDSILTIGADGVVSLRR